MTRIVHGPTLNKILGYTDSASVPKSGSPACFMECPVCHKTFRRKQSKMREVNCCSRKCAATWRSNQAYAQTRYKGGGL